MEWGLTPLQGIQRVYSNLCQHYKENLDVNKSIQLNNVLEEEKTFSLESQPVILLYANTISYLCNLEILSYMVSSLDSSLAEYSSLSD